MRLPLSVCVICRAMVMASGSSIIVSLLSRPQLLTLDQGRKERRTAPSKCPVIRAGWLPVGGCWLDGIHVVREVQPMGLRVSPAPLLCAAVGITLAASWLVV